MHVIVIDTETTGLIPKGVASRDISKCPHIMQLSYMVCSTDDFKIKEDYDAIIRLDDGVDISERSIEIHKITREKSRVAGVSIVVALYNLKRAINRYDVKLIVGHNISFDAQMIEIECQRNGLRGFVQSGSGSGSTTSSGNMINQYIPTYCTMDNSKDVCNNRVQSMYGGTYIRFSKLGEVFEKLFGEVDRAASAAETSTTSSVYAEYLHNSRVDVVMCLRIFIWLVYSVDVKTEWVDVMNTYTDKDILLLDDAHLLTDEVVRERYNICTGNPGFLGPHGPS
jgi:DNA polymerase III epsilon subunit-like protein